MSEHAETTNLPVLVALTDKIDVDSLDEMTARIKVKLVSELTKQGKVIPTDDDSVNTLLKVLGSIDSQTNNRRKIAVEEKAVDAATRAAANVSEIIRQANGHPFMVKPNEREIQGSVVSREPELPPIEKVDRQDYIGVDVLRYDDFVNEQPD